MTKLFSIITALFITLLSFGQSPQHVTQSDNEQVNFWESTTAMLIGAALILILIITRTWSKRIHNKRDDMVNDEKDKKD